MRHKETVHRSLALVLLFVNSGLAIYLCWDDAVAVASVAASSLVLVFLFALRLGCLEDNGGSTVSVGALLKAAICCLALALALLLLASEVVRTSPSALLAVPPCVLVVGGAAVGALCSCFLLLQHYYGSRSNQYQRDVLLPLVQEFQIKDMHVLAIN